MTTQDYTTLRSAGAIKRVLDNLVGETHDEIDIFVKPDDEDEGHGIRFDFHDRGPSVGWVMIVPQLDYSEDGIVPYLRVIIGGMKDGDQ